MRKDIKRAIWTLLAVTMVTGLAVWVDVPKHPKLAWGPLQRTFDFRLGLDLRGGSYLVYRADVSHIPATEVASALAGVRDVIERRVNAFGVSEPVIQTNQAAGEQRVIVELAGVYDSNEAIKLIGETPQLDFRQEVSIEELQKKLNIDAKNLNIQGPQFDRTDLTGKYLKRATVSFDQFGNTPQVSLEFDSAGTKLFADLTKKNLGKRIAIYLDGTPISAPTVQAEITNGKAVITGGFTLPEAKQLAQRLNSGALPVPIELIGQQNIGPSLGEASIQASIDAGILGTIAVMVWMIVFYRLPGVLASIALIIYAILFLALVKLIPITLTLAGIAGFILSIGMAVDANILIFERFRENVRAGKESSFALNDGFREAWDSIKASNVSALLTGLILYMFGTSIIRGFALTFALGVVLSMVTAITITRSLLHIALLWKKFHHPFFLAVKKLPSYNN